MAKLVKVKIQHNIISTFIVGLVVFSFGIGLLFICFNFALLFLTISSLARHCWFSILSSSLLHHQISYFADFVNGDTLRILNYHLQVLPNSLLYRFCQWRYIVTFELPSSPSGAASSVFPALSDASLSPEKTIMRQGCFKVVI